MVNDEDIFLDSFEDEEEYDELHFDSIKTQTSKAILFVDGEYEYWVPKALAHIDEEDHTVCVPMSFNPKLIKIQGAKPVEDPASDDLWEGV